MSVNHARLRADTVRRRADVKQLPVAGQRAVKKLNVLKAKKKRDDLVQKNVKVMTKRRTAADQTNQSDQRRKILKNSCIYDCV